MDPEAALQNMRDALGRYNDAAEKRARIFDLHDDEEMADLARLNVACEDAADDLAAAVEALDSWLSKGGFLPTAWERPAEPAPRTLAPCRDCGGDPLTSPPCQPGARTAFRVDL